MRYVETPEEPDTPCLQFLSFPERLVGMLFCTAVGWYLQWGSLSRLLNSIRSWDPRGFALSYSLGNCVSLAGSLFLVGFRKQLKSAAAPERRVVSCAFFGSLLFSLVWPLIFEGKFARLVTLVAVVAQIITYWVYFLSFFPRVGGALARSIAGLANAGSRLVRR